MAERRVGLTAFYAVAVPILLTTLLLAIGVGSTPINWRTIVHVAGLKLLPPGWVDASGLSKANIIVVWLIRVPRVVVAAFVGMGLAGAGAVMQGLFRNPLAEPSLVGSGAGAV